MFEHTSGALGREEFSPTAHCPPRVNLRRHLYAHEQNNLR